MLAREDIRKTRSQQVPAAKSQPRSAPDRDKRERPRGTTK